MKRKPLKPGLRFDVFHRDAFTCLYCGRKPPAVVLWVDHVIAVANGGTDGMDNLVTSCVECNLGKSDKDIERAKVFCGPNAEESKLRLEQLKQYNAMLIEEAEYMEDVIHDLLIYWAGLEGQPKKSKMIETPGALRPALHKFLKRLSLDVIHDSMRLAFERIDRSNDARFRYFCGICWKKIRDAEDKKKPDSIAAENLREEREHDY